MAIGGSPGRSVSYESDNELRLMGSAAGTDKSKDNELKANLDYSDDDDERLDIDDEPPRKLPPPSDKADGTCAQRDAPTTNERTNERTRLQRAIKRAP